MAAGAPDNRRPSAGTGSGVTSPFQAIAPGMLTTSAPGIAIGCQTLNVAPAGSAKTAIRLRSNMPSRRESV